MQYTLILDYLKNNTISILTNLGSSLFLMGVVYLIVWVILAKPLAKKRVQLSKRAGNDQIKNEIINTVLVVIVNVIFTGFIFWLKDNGYTQFYTETGKYGLWYEVFTVLAVFVIADGWFYWVHRLLHHPKIYKFIHAEHHKSLDTTPFTSNSFHVLETILLTLWIIPVALLFPLSLFSLGINQAVGLFNNIKSHLGYELYPKFFANIFPLNMLVTSTNHNLHHTRYNGNYGLQLRFWDIICGTEISETQNVFKSIHERKQVKILDNTKYQKITVTKLVREIADTTSIYFEPENQDFYNYQAGQYINIRAKLNGKNLDRSFSLSSSPEDKYLRITVKLNGEVSHYFHNQAKIGDTIQALLPVGDFGITPVAENQKNYLMIAGGSGITPLYSMIKTLLKDEPKSKITLFYANKTTESTIFLQEIQALETSYPISFSVKYFVNGYRFKETDILEFTQVNPDFQCFICGPDSLKAAARSYLKAQNVAEKDVYTEDFVDGYVPWFGLAF